MDLRIVAKPERTSRYGFENTPLSKFLIFASGAVTANCLLIPGEYSALLKLHWPLVRGNREVWRLITSQFVYESTVELLYGSALMYNLRVLERQWGTRKFASFILATCSLTIGSHFLAYYCNQFHSTFSVSDTLVSGLYGPIFALLLFYAKDVYSGSVAFHNGLSITNKWFSYFIAMRMMFVSRRSLIASSLGLISGIIYGMNFMYVRNWLCIPSSISNIVQSACDWFRVEAEPISNHRKTLCGATEEIHDDMVYDYLSKLQMSGRGLSMGSRTQMGQGYSDTLQPADSSLQEFLDALRLRSEGSDNQYIERPQGNFNSQDDPNVAENHEDAQDTENEIQRLVEMGFTRAAVIGALENADHDMERATNILLSQ